MRRTPDQPPRCPGRRPPAAAESALAPASCAAALGTRLGRALAGPPAPVRSSAPDDRCPQGIVRSADTPLGPQEVVPNNSKAGSIMVLDPGVLLDKRTSPFGHGPPGVESDRERAARVRRIA